MPDPNDNTLDVELESEDMADQAVQAHEQNMAQLAQVGVIAQTNFVQTTKLADLDYLENKRLVDLTEAMGAREVAAKGSVGP